MIKRRNSRGGDLDLSTFMSLMVVLIPVLLAAAEFAKITVIEIENDTKRLMSGRMGVKADQSTLLKATVLVTDSAVTVGTADKLLESIRFFTPQNGESWEKTVVKDESGTVKNAFITNKGEILTDSLGAVASSIKSGETHYLSGIHPITIKDASLYNSRPLLVTELLEVQLQILQYAYSEAPDSKEIVIGANEEVIYEYLVQMMDSSRKSGFEDISFAKIVS